MKTATKTRFRHRLCQLSAVVLGAFVLAGAAPASAALTVGASAPTFTAQAALAGEPFAFDLAQALKQGPVVLYFYPAAFTQGCTVEAQAFADAIGDFKALGATVVGVSGDDIETLKKFWIPRYEVETRPVRNLVRSDIGIGTDDRYGSTSRGRREKEEEGRELGKRNNLEPQ